MSDIALGLGLVILAILVLWIVPKRQIRSLTGLTRHEQFKIENEARKVMAEILGGAIVLMGLFFTWQSVKSTAENLRISQEAQITERFIRAIEQLGKTDDARNVGNLAIRLGGIWSLERIAEDSEKDYWPIMEILSTYVRQRAAWKEAETSALPDQVLPALDIQAILTVLGRRIRSYKNGEHQRLDLGGTDLRRADLNGATFQGVNLIGTHLYRARLTGIHLEGADLTNADLSRAVLHEAHLEGADLTGAILDGTTLTGANLKGVKGLKREQVQSAEMNSETQLPWIP